VALRSVAYKPLFKASGKFLIESGVTISGFENISLGENVSIMKNSYLCAVDGLLSIGNNFSCNTNVRIDASGGSITIEDDCMIGPNCVLRAANHSFDRTDIPMRLQGHSYGAIHLENDVWIASNCVVTANTTIGEGSIVAAGSVVNKGVPALSIIRGVPAKFVAKRRPYDGSESDEDC